MSEVHKITIELAKPRGSFPGRTEDGWYVVVDGAVVMTNADGKPVDGNKRHLNPGDDARLIACRLLRGRKRSSRLVSDWTAPIHYQRSKYL